MQPEMKYIYTVYQCGSFSKAAEKLFLTQPALSISVQKVEHEVGMPLFNRDKKPLEITEAGMIYIQKIEQIQHLEQELAMQLNDLTDLKRSEEDICVLAELIILMPIFFPLLLQLTKKSSRGSVFNLLKLVPGN